MKMLVGLPYLRDVCRKARSGCFGPFVRYGTFPILSVKKRKKQNKIQRKREEEEINIYNYKNREENQTEKKRHNITSHAT